VSELTTDVAGDEELDDELAFLLSPIRRGDHAAPNDYLWFDPWLGAGSPRLRQLVAHVRQALADQEEARGERQRARKAADAANHELAIEVVVSNLARASLEPADRRRLNVLTGHKTQGATRYDNRALGKPFMPLLDALGRLGLLSRRPSATRGIASLLAPEEGFQARMHESGVTLADFRKLPGQEVIELRRKSKVRQYGQEFERMDLVDYEDTADTNRMRDEMRRINSMLGAADITFIDDGRGLVETHQRTLKRIFTMRHEDPLPQRFDQSGRMFGGFWIGLERERRAQIRIEGETLADLDFSSMFLRLAYAQAGVTPPRGDLYAVPGLEGHRAAVKVAVNALLFDKGKRHKWPDLEDRQRPGIGWSEFMAGFTAMHSAIVPHTGEALGMGFMHLESEIMVEVLTRLADQGVVALPIHDGLMVKASAASMARTAMEVVAREMTTADIPVILSYF
jgi:hypothetical protein